MTPTSTTRALTFSTGSSTMYEIRVACHLDDHWAGTLGDLTLTRLDDGTTSLTGLIVDQAQLHGILAGVRDLGVPLLTLRALDGPEPPAKSPPVTARPTLAGPLCTERLTLRPGTPADADSTWAYRRLEIVGEWLTETATDLDAYRAAFIDPDRLASTVIVERAGVVIGDFMLRIQDAWAQVEVADQARGHHVLASDGANRDASRGPRDRRVAAPVGTVARHAHLRPPGHGVDRNDQPLARW